MARVVQNQQTLMMAINRIIKTLDQQGSSPRTRSKRKASDDDEGERYQVKPLSDEEGSDTSTPCIDAPRSRVVSRNEDESRSDDNEEIGEYSGSRKRRRTHSHSPSPPLSPS
jgi:hypothetical protein